jgi:GT2 family glycosyltransferase
VKNIAIVILNWNGESFLKEFLPYVIRYSGDARIIVADNGSSDGSLALLKNDFPTIECIELDRNHGFAGGYNEALKQVEAEFYLLLNSDIEVSPNWLDPLIELMEDKTIAGCQPKVLAHHNKTLFEHAGASGGYLDKNYFPFCRGRIFDIFEHDEGQYDGKTEIFWATGAALFIRAELFHQVGGFDPAFFAHMEEIDLCWRIKKLGYSFYVNPSSTIYHVGGGTLPYKSPKKTYLNFRNSLFMIVKNHEGFLVTKLIHRMLLDGIAAIRFLLLFQFKQLNAVFKAHMALYKRLPVLLQQRKEIRSTATTSSNSGIYNGSILWARYFKGVRKFSQLNQRLFLKK